MKLIRFIAQGSNSAIGGFSAGDTARCNAALAEHLVKEARVAEFVEPSEKPKSSSKKMVSRTKV